MLIFTFILLFATSQARVIDEDCDGIVIRNRKYERELLKDGVASPYQLAIDYDTNTLFFSYSSYGIDDPFRSAYINLKTNEFGLISGISGGFANTVDGKNHVVYLGGNNGIYTYNFTTQTANFFGAGGTSIWQLFFKDRLYYTEYPDERAYYYEDSVSRVVPELNGVNTMLLAVDNQGNIYSRNSSGLFCYTKETQDSNLLGNYNVNAFASDISGKLYFSTPSEIYVIEDNQKVKLLTSVSDIYGLAIEGDGNVIIATQHSVERLKPTNTFCIPDVDKNVI